jgi:hypothetical protein
MADTDDDQQTMARRPRVPARGADGVPEQATADEERLAERRELWIAAGRSADDFDAGRSDEELAAELAEAESQLVEEKTEAEGLRHDEDLALDDHEERELRAARLRRDQALDNDAEIANAMRRADFAERNHRQLRAKAADERLLARGDSAHAGHLRDGAVGHDDPQSDADLKAADRAQARASSRDRIANDDDRRADWNYVEGRAQRSLAEQPSPAEAVRNAPEEPPVARKNVKRLRRPEKKNSKALRDFGLGD